MKVKGFVQMSRAMGGGSDFFRLCITDDDSNTQFLELRLSPSQFADLLSSRAFYADMDVQTNLLGKKHEHKEVEVEWEGYCVKDGKNIAKAKKAVAAHEVDGWKARIEDLFNGHRSHPKKRGVWRVTFDRWVDKVQEQGHEQV